MGWKWRENNRDKVLEALRRGEYEAILTSRAGRWMRWPIWLGNWACWRRSI